MTPKAPKPADVPDKVRGIAPELWRSTHDPSITEHAAGRFFLSWNGALDVEPQQVVLGEAEAADGCVGF